MPLGPGRRCAEGGGGRSNAHCQLPAHVEAPSFVKPGWGGRWGELSPLEGEALLHDSCVQPTQSIHHTQHTNSHTQQDDIPDAILPAEPVPGWVASQRPLPLLSATELILSNGMRVVSAP